VLETLVRAGTPATLSELMVATGLPKPSLHRTLALFEEAGLVMREPTGRAYGVGPRLERFALDVLTHDRVAAERHVVLRRLVADVGETCNLSMLRKGEVVYLDRVEADWPLRLHLPVGSTLPPHCCASGKLLLAFKEPASARTWCALCRCRGSRANDHRPAIARQRTRPHRSHWLRGR